MVQWCYKHVLNCLMKDGERQRKDSERTVEYMVYLVRGRADCHVSLLNRLDRNTLTQLLPADDRPGRVDSPKITGAEGLRLERVPLRHHAQLCGNQRRRRPGPGQQHAQHSGMAAAPTARRLGGWRQRPPLIHAQVGWGASSRGWGGQAHCQSAPQAVECRE